jgi:ATP-binding cassette subfamily B multidrug efflux pump
MFAFFEKRVQPTALHGSPPPEGLLAFYWHFVRQARGLFGAMFVTGLVVALIDTLIPVFIGRLVRLMEAQDRCGCTA